jgi:hypothetical protein
MKTILPLFFIALSTCCISSSYPCDFQQCDLNLYNNRLFAPSQYNVFSNAISVQDAIKLQQLNNARDSMMIGGVGDIRRNLKSQIDRIVAAEALNINNCRGSLNLGSSIVC